MSVLFIKILYKTGEFWPKQSFFNVISQAPLFFYDGSGGGRKGRGSGDITDSAAIAFHHFR